MPRFCSLAALSAALLFPLQGASAQLSWDNNSGVSGPQGGTGNWTTLAGTLNWWNGAADAAWTNGNDAIFGGSTGVITASAAVSANSVTFNTGGYSLVNGAAGVRVIPVGDVTVDTTSSTDHTLITIGNASTSILFDMAATNRTYSIGSGDSINFVNGIRGTAGLTKTGAGLLTISGSSTPYTGGTTISGGTLRLGVSSAIGTGAMSISGGTFDLQAFNQTVSSLQLTGGGSISGTGTLTSTSAFDVQSGSISAKLGGSVGLTKSGPGTVTITSSNTYTGVNTISGGILNISADLSLGALPGVAANNIVFDGGTLQLAGAVAIGATRSFVLNAGGGTIDTNGFSPTSATNAISGAGSFTKAGAGAYTFNTTGSKTYTGGTFVTGGSLKFGVSNLLPSSGNVTIDGGTLDLAVSTQTAPATVSLISGSIAATTGVLKANAFDLQSGTVAAKLQDNAAGATLTKSTPGTVTLTGINTYTGATAVNAGALLVNGSLGASSVVTVGASGTLGGSGVIGGATTVNGTLAPGNSPGLLTFSSSLLLASGSTANFELNGTTRGGLFDAVDIAGSLTLAGNIVVQPLGYTPTAGDSFDLLNWGALNATGFNVGSNLQLPNVSGFGLAWDSSAFLSSGVLTLQAVPEPSTWMMLLAGATVCLFATRARHRQA